jgi:predicted 3-demethylubiquinone-9 3-methyltransferase (glyoxalase superfamily)
MPADLTSCLWFETQAEEAARHYAALIPDSAITDIVRGPDGAVIMVEFKIAGRPVWALNGNPSPGFVDASSLVLHCHDQAELDRVWDGLIAGGGAPKACGWLADRYGVAWQIIPARLGALLARDDPAAADRVMQAVWSMVKLDLATLETARAG